MAEPVAFLLPAKAEADSDLEYQAPEEIARRQLALLKEHLAYAGAHSPFYRERFQSAGFCPEEMESLADLAALPCTEKQDLHKENDRLRAAPEAEIVDLCLTSASTSDRPCILPQTANDLARLAYNEAAAFRMLGIGEENTLMVCAALDRCFMAGLAYFLGGVKRQAQTVRSGAGTAGQHWSILEVTQPDTLVGVPSLMRKMGEHGMERGVQLPEMGVRKLIAIGEQTRSPDLRLTPAAAALEAMWGAQVYSTYASTEMATAFCECPERCGGHLRPELLVLEIVNEAGQPVGPGEPGEVVVTPLGVTGMPLVRFRTGDISRVLDAPCPCGRQTVRLAPVLGRRNQMLKFRGTTVFPSAILAALEGLPEVAAALVEARKGADGQDRIEVCVQLQKESFASEQQVAILEEAVREKVRVRPRVRLVSEAEMAPRMYPEGKRKRVTFLDYR